MFEDILNRKKNKNGCILIKNIYIYPNRNKKKMSPLPYTILLIQKTYRRFQLFIEALKIQYKSRQTNK